ncbi:MAG: ketopantoate reductase family protein [Promethearchaeota archaeon]
MNKKLIKIGFIGAGSIGSLFGGYLASIYSDEYNIKIILFCRETHSNTINKNGLILKKKDDYLKVKNIKAFENINQYLNQISKNSDKIFDFLFLTTKTYDIMSSMREYKSIIDLCKYFVILQNGIGNEKIVKKFCKPIKIIRIITSNGAYLKEPGCVIHTGPGITKIGFPYIKELKTEKNRYKQALSDLKILITLLNKAGIKTIFVNDILKECWEKIFVNIGINPFGALTRLKNGDLLKINRLKILMEEAVIEAVKVAQLKNIDLSKKNYVNIMFDVAVKTSENTNSMLQDVLKKKKTEIDFMNGKIVELADKLGVNVPINKMLTVLIKGLESSFI